MAASSATAFDRHQFDAIYPPGVEAHYWVRARNRLIGGFLAELGLPADEPILEIGCGRGIVVAYLAARGRHIEGVELAPVPPVPEAAARVRSGLGFEALPEADRARYRTLLLLDVIEHIGDRPRFLREILAAFPAARRIVVTVPARQEVWSNYDEFNGHFLRYDIPELERLAAASGLRCAGARYLFHALYWP
ncbi:MAG TPA: class I SAM-dependent methyltransferase, partial [Candidatus Methylacidiphilales bacterium]